MNNIGLIGLGVMGQNLVLNMLDHGFTVSVFNRTYTTTQEFIQTTSKDNLHGFENLKEFVLSLEKPRKIILLVSAGTAVDNVIDELSEFIQSGDIIIDSGNSFYKDTDKRFLGLSQKNVKFIGLGISGGEEGARNGASFMAGGEKDAFEILKPILEILSAKDFKGGHCVGYFGTGGAGHFVKMIHNGIEYVDMQLIADFYLLIKRSNKDNSQAAQIFEEFNNGRSKSYLLEITSDILKKMDEDNNYLIDKILDISSQKGTGQWASIAALEYGIPAYSFSNSVFSRYISTLKDKRTKLSEIYNENINCSSLVPSLLEKAYYAAKIISYAQGLEIIKIASDKNNWNIDMSECARIWQGGCIIRAELLNILQGIYKKDNSILNILEDIEIAEVLKSNIQNLREISSFSILNGTSIPGILSTITYFDAYTTNNSQANLISAQRDYFGAHGFKRNDKVGDFHVNWKN